MAHLVVFVVNHVDQCTSVLDVWEAAGAQGATIVESTGLRRIRCAPRDDLPLMPSLRDLLEGQEMHHRTLFTVVDDDETLGRLIDATRDLVGSFDRADAGFMFVTPVTAVFGLHKELEDTDPCSQ